MSSKFGGQALIEGIMIRGALRAAVVIRKEDGTFVERTYDTMNQLGINVKIYLSDIFSLPFKPSPSATKSSYAISPVRQIAP